MPTFETVASAADQAIASYISECLASPVDGIDEEELRRRVREAISKVYTE